jgi:chemotaxis protein CheZ
MALPASSADIEKRLRDLSKMPGSVDPEEILEVVQSVMATLGGDHSSLNHRLHADIEALANYINGVKAEIADIKADRINSEYLPEASDQLSAIVGGTEQATNDIFEAIESIEELAQQMDPKLSAQVTEAVTRVYEACGFQDITGQRVAKVVTALQNIEAKVGALLQTFGEMSGAGACETAPEPRANGAVRGDSDEELMHGPQLPDNAISQDDVDALLASFD